MECLGFFSDKGGTGKTSLALSFSLNLAKQNFNVCLLDLDLYGPSLYQYVDKKPNCWINDFLSGKEKLQDCLIDCSKLFNLEPNRLIMGFSNPANQEIEEVAQANNFMAISWLKKLLTLKSIIKDPPYFIDFFITDNAPGLNFLTINSILVTDNCHFILSFKNSELLSNLTMTSNRYELVKNRIIKAIEGSILAIKKREGITVVTPVEKFIKLPKGEMEVYFDIIANDPDLKDILE